MSTRVRMNKHRMSHKYGRESGPTYMTSGHAALDRLAVLKMWSCLQRAWKVRTKRSLEHVSTTLPFRSRNWLRKRKGLAQADVP